ncbi:hypothetical protein J4231_02280 [Candidatus Woesearchaeota archaeon]|nr:hypothetical protein [Candidatus Woesearchaeota archaeon]
MRKALKHLGYIKSPRLGARIATGFVKGMLLKMPVLRSVELAINYECNAKCDMCYARDLLDSKRINLSVEQIKNIWNQAHDLGDCKGIKAEINISFHCYKCFFD